MDKTKYKIIIITLVVLLIAAVIAGVALYLQNAKLKENNATTVENTVETAEISVTNCTLKAIDGLTYKVVYDENDKEEKTIVVDNNTIRFKELGNVYVNDLMIETCSWQPDIYLLDRTLIVVTSGTDVRSVSVCIFNNEGTIEKTIYRLDSKYNDMVIGGAEEPITIDKEGLKFNGTRLTHGPCFAGDYDREDLTGEPWSKKVMLEHIDEPVYGTYEMKYLGNGKFGELTNTGYTLLKDSSVMKNIEEREQANETQATNATTDNKPYVSAYKALIDEKETANGHDNKIKYDLVYFDNDEIPELVIQLSKPDLCLEIYTIANNGSVKQIGVFPIGDSAGRGVDYSPKQKVAMVYSHDSNSYLKEYYETNESGELERTYYVEITGLNFETNDENVDIESGEKTEHGKLLYSDLSKCNFEALKGVKTSQEIIENLSN